MQQHQSMKFSASSTGGLSTKSSSEVKFSSLTNEKIFNKSISTEQYLFFWVTPANICTAQESLIGKHMQIHKIRMKSYNFTQHLQNQLLLLLLLPFTFCPAGSSWQLKGNWGSCEFPSLGDTQSWAGQNPELQILDVVRAGQTLRSLLTEFPQKWSQKQGWLSISRDKYNYPHLSFLLQTNSLLFFPPFLLSFWLQLPPFFSLCFFSLK